MFVLHQFAQNLTASFHQIIGSLAVILRIVPLCLLAEIQRLRSLAAGDFLRDGFVVGVGSGLKIIGFNSIPQFTNLLQLRYQLSLEIIQLLPRERLEIEVQVRAGAEIIQLPIN
ncbi:hypothetical protein SLEP1_g45058 [Rubroshorea leprosula]|uniref:Uncharacterized protein n=1 Tax=Rubroshorea leprosula TaxID=152421 RepID=A0AAV5LIH8_9ROSI|nr:hypothetical protein SLEP1_g45058 [Rubroshorea leprosula]